MWSSTSLMRCVAVSVSVSVGYDHIELGIANVLIFLSGEGSYVVLTTKIEAYHNLWGVYQYDR